MVSNLVYILCITNILRVIQAFAATQDSIEVPQLNLQEMDTTIHNIEALKHKVALLLNMVGYRDRISIEEIFER